MSQHEKLRELLGLRRAPVALAFRETPPPGLPRVQQPGPAGCSYWKMAAEGGAFYTEAADHHGCVIGSHTHGVELPAEKAQELQSMIGTMVGLEYLQADEVASIPTRSAPFGVAIYAPLGAEPCPPDVVLVRGNARQIMLVAEAARAAGIGHEGAAMGRPACSMIPATTGAARATLSLACIGNRVYTGLGDEELYFAIPGPRLAEVTVKLETIIHANRELEKFHQARLGD